MQNDYEKGLSVDGRPVGIWEYYGADKQLDLTMDYDSSRIRYARPDTSRYLLRVDGDWREARPARPPRFLGSKAKWIRDIGREVRYPTDMLASHTGGKLTIAYTVDTQGHAVDFELIQPLTASSREAVWSVLKEAPNQWIPAIYRGRPIEARFFLTVEFNLFDSRQLYQAWQEAQKQQSSAKLPHPAYVNEVVVTAVGVSRQATPPHR